MCALFWCCFFFQAEDGIRDLVRSRGLGDVYKRQAPVDVIEERIVGPSLGQDSISSGFSSAVIGYILAVSYTHLTLPTSDLV